MLRVTPLAEPILSLADRVVVSRKQKLLAAGAVVAVGLALAQLFPRGSAVGPLAAEAAHRDDARRTSQSLSPIAALDGQLSPTPPVVAAMTSLSHGSESPLSDFAPAVPLEPPASTDVTPAPSPAGASAGRPVYAPGDGAPEEPPHGDSDHRIHVIHNGDTLERLAERYLGDGGRALDIFDVNRDVLENPHLLPIGAELRIPGAAINSAE